MASPAQWIKPDYIDDWYDKSLASKYSLLMDRYYIILDFNNFTEKVNVCRDLKIVGSSTMHWEFGMLYGSCMVVGKGSNIIYKDPFPIVNSKKYAFVITATEDFNIYYKSSFYKSAFVEHIPWYFIMCGNKYNV